MKAAIIIMVLAALTATAAAQSNQTYVLTGKVSLLPADSQLAECSALDVGCQFGNAIIRIDNMVEALVALPGQVIDAIIDRFKTLIDGRGGKSAGTITEILWLPFNFIVWLIKSVALLATDPAKGLSNLLSVIVVVVGLLGIPFLVLLLFLESLILVKVLITNMGRLDIYVFFEGLVRGNFYYLDLTAKIVNGLWLAIKPGG